MLNLNKKGSAYAPETIAGLIEFVIVCIIIFAVVLAFVYWFSPTASSVGCGLNTRVRAATLSKSSDWVAAPVLMCGQYNTPVNINAADFKACSGIADFCKSAKGQLLVECWKQCARIQVDALTDSCWTMAGSGRLDFKDSVFETLAKIASNPVALGVITFTGGAAYFIAGPYVAGLVIGGELALGVISSTGGSKILRCYRFKIVNPIISPVDKKPINYFDDSFGRSWSYGLNSSNIIDPKACSPTEENPMCSFGGDGVNYINELGEGKYEVNGKNITVPTDAKQLYMGSVLTYNITDARNQVCYIAYYQINGETKIKYKDPSGEHEVSIGDRYVTRSCYSWSQYVGKSSYIN